MVDHFLNMLGVIKRPPDEPESDPGIVPPEGLYQPIRGFGKVWRTQPGVRQQLGWAPSYGWKAAYLRTADGRAICMYRSGSWESFYIRVYDMQSLEVVCNLAGHGPGNWVRDIVITPDNRHALSAASNHIKVWDLENGREVVTIDDTSKIQALALTPDARYVLSGSVDMFIKIWDWRTGKKVEQFVSGHTKAISDLAITPDGHHVVSSSADGTLKTGTGKGRCSSIPAQAIGIR